MVKNELVGGRWAPRQTDWNSAYEGDEGPPLITGEGALLLPRASPTPKACQHFAKNENANNFQILQCHQGAEKGLHTGCHLSRRECERAFFSIKFLKINVLCCSE